MAEHPIEGMMGVTMEKIRQLVDANTIIGEPITVDGATIIPISRVTFGFAALMLAQKPTSRCLAAAPARAFPLHPSRFW